MAVPRALRLVAVAVAATIFSQSASAHSLNVTDTTDYSNLTVALVRAPPLGFPEPLMSYNYSGLKFDLNGTVSKGISLIEEAASNGANLIVFPELWFPGYEGFRVMLS